MALTLGTPFGRASGTHISRWTSTGTRSEWLSSQATAGAALMMPSNDRIFLDGRVLGIDIQSEVYGLFNRYHSYEG